MQAALSGVLKPSSSQASRNLTASVDTDVEVSNTGDCCNTCTNVVARAINAIVVLWGLCILVVSTTIAGVIGSSSGCGRRGNCHADGHN